MGKQKGMEKVFIYFEKVYDCVQCQDVWRCKKNKGGPEKSKLCKNERETLDTSWKCFIPVIFI